MVMSQAWQQPYVNLFKHFGVGEWTKCSKEGDVTKIMDRTMKSSIYRISGAIASANYIQFPKTKASPLYLTGHYVYILFKPVVGKFFSIHMDLVTSDDLVVRVSMSNMFKEFKLTSTWLQFPVLCNPPYGSVEEATSANMNVKDRLGVEPSSSRWTLLCLDTQYVLSMYLNKHFSHVKTVRLCSTMFVKNVFTSSTFYEPGLDIKLARKTGMLAKGVVPLPREMSFSLEKHEEWHLKYDHIKFPSTGKPQIARKNMAGFSIPYIGREKSLKQLSTLHAVKSVNSKPSRVTLSERMTSSTRDVNKSTSFKELPEVGLEHPVKDTNSLEIHSAATSRPKVVSVEKSTRRHIDSEHQYRQKRSNQSTRFANSNALKNHVKASGKENSRKGEMKITKNASKSKTLQFDPIIKLNKIVGFDNNTDALWLGDGGDILSYTCHSCVVLYNAKTKAQKFLLGHSEKITAFCASGNFLASAQAGENSLVRVWKVNHGTCVSMFQANLEDVNLLSFSKDSTKLCTVGLDVNKKQVMAIWDTSQALSGGNASLIAKAHTEMSKAIIETVKFVPFDDTRLVSCGHGNIRAWRLRPKYLKSCPVDLGQFRSTHFTDFAFEVSNRLRDDVADIKIFVTSTNGNLYEVRYRSLKVTDIHSLWDKNLSKKPTTTEPSSGSSSSSALNSISVCHNFCAVGSADGYLRLWPLSFKSVYLEAEFEGCVNHVCISQDATKVSGGTASGNLGIVDVVEKSYCTVTRSHTFPILDFSFQNTHQQLATVSDDKSIKLWNLDTFNQVYDFQSTTELPTSVCCHPSQAELACGFKSGAVRVFSLDTTSLKFDLQEHYSCTHSVRYSPNGNFLYSAASDGSLIMYDVHQSYDMSRALTNVVVKECTLPNYVVAVDANGHRMAVIGPSQYLVTVFGANSLDELVRIDTTITTHTEPRYMLDAVTGVCFAPAVIGHLIVITAQSRLLKFNAKSGQLISEISNLHKDLVTGLCVSACGKYIATAARKAIKVWNYAMECHQTFIGHTSTITKLEFTSKCDQLISCGEAIFAWDVVSTDQQTKDNLCLKNENSTKEAVIAREDAALMERKCLVDTSMIPREAPQPSRPLVVESPANNNPFVFNLSTRESVECSSSSDHEETGNDVVASTAGGDNDSWLVEDAVKEIGDEVDFAISDEKHDNIEHDDWNDINHDASEEKNELDITDISPNASNNVMANHSHPDVLSHYKSRTKTSELAVKRYAAPVNQAGMSLRGVIGCQGNAKQNIAWHPETGLFLYTLGCQLVSEDLSNGKQRLYFNPLEEISTIALQYDAKVVAVGGCLNMVTRFGAVLIWDLSNGRIQKTLEHHTSSIIALQYSRDDRFLVSVGDYRECSFAVWTTNGYLLLTQATTESAIHAMAWHPYSANEFVSVGRNNSVYFWCLADDHNPPSLQRSQGEVPHKVSKRLQDKHNDVTSVAYAGKDLLLTATAGGVVCAWSIRSKRCFMHWQADNSEIVALSAACGKIVTCSSSKKMKLWSLPSMENILTADRSEFEVNGVVMEDEESLDSAIMSAVFDDVIEMGVVGTSSGAVWYVNWAQDGGSEIVRLVSGHQEKINNMAVCSGDENYLATACADGCLKLWSLENREQVSQFMVLNQQCLCVSFCCEYKEKKQSILSSKEYNQIVHPVELPGQHPSQCIAGYEDGTVRMFDFGQMKMLLKMKPHSRSVTAIGTSLDGRVAISGDKGGVIAISSLSTGLTIRVLTDHKGAVLSKISYGHTSLNSSLWLACSNDCRISIWKSDWSKDVCELNDWLTFASPGVVSEKKYSVKNEQSPCLAEFSPIDEDVLVYTGHGIHKEINFYSMTEKKVIRSISIANWVLSMHLSESSNILVVGCQDRLVKLIDCDSGTFQDFFGHTDSVFNVHFANSGKTLISSAYSEILLWSILL